MHDMVSLGDYAIAWVVSSLLDRCGNQGSEKLNHVPKYRASKNETVARMDCSCHYTIQSSVAYVQKQEESMFIQEKTCSVFLKMP